MTRATSEVDNGAKGATVKSDSSIGKQLAMALAEPPKREASHLLAVKRFRIKATKSVARAKRSRASFSVMIPATS